MVSAISFGTTGSFSEKIKQPQTYTVKEEPAAAAPINKGGEKSSFGKKLLKFIGIALGVVGILALIGKTGVCAVPEGAAETTMNKIKGGLDKAGKAVCNYVKNKLPEAAEQVSEAATEKAPQIIDNVV